MENSYILKGGLRYIMVAIVKTISLNPEEAQFLELNKYSPTALLKMKIREIQENQFINAKIQRLMETLHKYSTFLDQKGLLDEFNNGFL